MKKTLLLVATILAPLAIQAQETKEDKAPKKERKGPPAEIIAKFDKDGDGKLDKEERAAHMAEMKKVRAEMIAKYDTDKDGKLSMEERKVAIVAQFDKDGDGVLNDEEKATAEQARRTMMGGRGPRGEGKGKGEGKGPRGEGKKKMEKKEEAPAE